MRTSRLSRRVSICSWLAIAHQPSSRRYRGLSFEVKERLTETEINEPAVRVGHQDSSVGGKPHPPAPSPKSERSEKLRR
jgi:hypothetical protein